jgi:hypothetical protein
MGKRLQVHASCLRLPVNRSAYQVTHWQMVGLNPGFQRLGNLKPLIKLKKKVKKVKSKKDRVPGSKYRI